MTDELKHLPPHEFDEIDFCRHCGVPRFAVEDRFVIPQCGARAASEQDASIPYQPV